jgi:hypothetical protein
LHLFNFVKKSLAVIWLLVLAFDPRFTRNNAAVVTKETAIEKNFNYGVVVGGKSKE